MSAMTCDFRKVAAKERFEVCGDIWSKYEGCLEGTATRLSRGGASTLVNPDEENTSETFLILLWVLG